MEKSKTNYKKNMLMGGLFSLFLGAFLLLITQNIMGGFLSWWPLLLLALGLMSFFQAFFGSKRPRYFFHGTFLVGSSMLLLIDHFFLVEENLEELWPLYFIIVGLSLLVYSLRIQAVRRRITFLVPGSTIIFFGFIVSLFSFRLVDQPFISFVKGWWPILFLASGLVLISISLAQHTQIENKEKHSSNKDLQKDESSEK
jgi:hypothetical protein